MALCLPALLLVVVPSVAISASKRHVELLAPKGNAVPASLKLIEPSEPDFNQLVSLYFPGIIGISNFREMRPFLALLRNSRSVPAVAYDLRWVFIYKGNKAETISQSFMMRPLSHRENVTLMPDSARLLSVKFNFTPGDYGASASFPDRIAALRLPRTANLVSCVANLDGVVYADQTYSGPKGAQTWRRWAVAQIADRDEAIYVLNLMNASNEGHSFSQILESQVHRGREDRGNHTMDIYIRARGESAIQVGVLLRRNGPTGAVPTLARVPGGVGAGVVSALGKRYERRFPAKLHPGDNNASK